MQTIFIAEFCPCKYESSFEVISAHIAEENAQRAMEQHKAAHMGI